MDDMDNMDPMDPMGAMDDKDKEKMEEEKSEYSYKDDDIVIKNYPREESEESWVPYYSWTISIACRFDISFIVILIIQNINFGFWVLIQLSYREYFKVYHNKNLGDRDYYDFLIMLPWSLMPIFGLITDMIPIFGLRRKPYLIFFGIAQAVFMYMAAAYFGDDSLMLAVFLFLTSVCVSFQNVVIDAIMVCQSRKDPLNGAQDLISVSWLARNLTGVLACTLAALTIEKMNPRYYFLFYAGYGSFVAVSAFFLNSAAERDHA
jgi:hypothetical protein